MHRLLRRIYGGQGVRLVNGDAAPAVVDKLRAFFDGDINAIDDIPVETGGTPFQRDVWTALRQIPAGETWSYARLAHHVGRPAAVRAVGAANGANPIGVVVPCHRVIGADGSLTGYGGGMDRKAWLLAHERTPARSLGRPVARASRTARPIQSCQPLRSPRCPGPHCVHHQKATPAPVASRSAGATWALRERPSAWSDASIGSTALAERVRTRVCLMGAALERGPRERQAREQVRHRAAPRQASITAADSSGCGRRQPLHLAEGPWAAQACGHPVAEHLRLRVQVGGIHQHHRASVQAHGIVHRPKPRLGRHQARGPGRLQGGEEGVEALQVLQRRPDQRRLARGGRDGRRSARLFGRSRRRARTAGRSAAGRGRPPVPAAAGRRHTRRPAAARSGDRPGPAKGGAPARRGRRDAVRSPHRRRRGEARAPPARAIPDSAAAPRRGCRPAPPPPAGPGWAAPLDRSSAA